MNKQNIVLVDSDITDEWEYPHVLKKVTGEKWFVKSKNTCKYRSGRGKILKYFWFFIFPLTIVINRHKYAKIIAWQQFFGLNIAFFMRLFRLKKANDLTVMTFIYKRKNGITGSLYHKYIHFIVTSGYIDRFICFAKEECNYYSSLFGVEKSKFVFEPLGVAKKNRYATSDKGYIFATGRSNRNYDFLVNTLNSSGYELIIACDTYKNRRISNNVKILDDCHGDTMLKLMAESHCVAVPLKDLNISSGQLVILQAMAMGKPVVCTNAEGVKDYVTDGITGFLADNSKELFLKAIHKLYSNKPLYETMCVNARHAYENKYTSIAMFERIAAHIK